GLCGRVIWKRVLRRRYLKNDAIKENVMIVLCSRARAEKTLENVQGDLYARFKVIGLFLIDYDPETDNGNFIGDVPVLGSHMDAVEYATHNWVDEVLMDLRHHQDLQTVMEGHFEKMGITTHHVMMKPSESEDSHFTVIEMCGRYVVATHKLREVSAMQWFLKRTLDIMGGIVGLLITGLIYIFIAPQIKLADPGPVFYASNRVGRNGRVFKMYKFRSMYRDADARKAELMSQNKMQGLMFKMDDDPRIIGSEKKDKNGKPKGIGNFIRKTSLDEFPQFLNVLKGDMSLVGTRPPTLDEWEHYSENHRIRLCMRPGITGMWQATGRSDITDFEEVVRLDEAYIQNWTVGLDIKLLLMTVLAVLKHKGAE
ncbi:MAG: sugar transferase, partial [Lachnospiraceae bacterium]|nr:sugar transferase [Lachnospiraceae bacterium]